MSKDQDSTWICIEHPNWNILINTGVRRILWGEEKATGVVVRDANGKEIIRETPLSTSISCWELGASALLQLPSNKDLKDELQNSDSNALHFTNHDNFAKAIVFGYNDPSIREKFGSIKLQSYVRLDSGKITLINLAINFSSPGVPSLPVLH